MRKFTITQTGPSIPSGEICYLTGEAGISFLGDDDCIHQSMQRIINNTKPDEAFTVEYVPWRGG